MTCENGALPELMEGLKEIKIAAAAENEKVGFLSWGEWSKKLEEKFPQLAICPPLAQALLEAFYLSKWISLVRAKEVGKSYMMEDIRKWDMLAKMYPKGDFVGIFSEEIKAIARGIEEERQAARK